jgi:3-oxoacyl-[acyl-carrier-protein] synthase II
MAGIAGAACSSNVLFGSREVGSDGASLAQYRGLRPVENMQLAPTGRRPSGSISTSGMSLSVLHFFFLPCNAPEMKNRDAT